MCNTERSYGSLFGSSTGTVTRVLVHYISQQPRTWHWLATTPVTHYLDYLNSQPALAHCEVLFCLANISERFLYSWTVCIVTEPVSRLYWITACLFAPALDTDLRYWIAARPDLLQVYDPDC